MKPVKSASILVLAFALLLLPGCSHKENEVEGELDYSRPEHVEEYSEAKTLLKEGNGSFLNETPRNKDLTVKRIEKLAKHGQNPYAVIVSCSDSRVPPEIIFDQGLGDLFVVRTAGNVVDDVVMGSIEYGAEHLGAKIIVVLGHTKCGAVKATVEGGEAPGSIGAVVKLIEPSLKKAEEQGLTGEKLITATENENIYAMAEKIEKSPLIKALVDKGEVTVLTAKYDIGTGKVSFR